MSAASLRVIEGGGGWSPQQREALDLVERWRTQLPRRSPVFYLAGYAGTGKSTLLRTIARDAGEVAFGAYTGKAASVMRCKGCTDATTIDRLIYHHPFKWRCRQRCGAAPCAELCQHSYQEWQGRQLNPFSAVANADLVIIDECSMVGQDIGNDLLSFEIPVLVVGDPGQLPPIGGAGFFTAREPDVFLSEVHRQAADNPIIHMATMARNGQAPLPGRFGDSVVVRLNAFEGDPTDYDIVICGKNATRRQINRQIREQFGFRTPLPAVGEKLLVLRNRHEKGLMNGEIVTVARPGDVANGFLPLVVATDAGDLVEIDAPVDLLLTDDSDATGAQGDPVTWGYTLTCHKAQGSQWSNVLLIDESICFREHRWRWLYTAITRAAERITVVR